MAQEKLWNESNPDKGQIKDTIEFILQILKVF
jgi:hypothetical protein